MTENIAGVCTRIEFNLRHNVQSLFYCFERFSVNSRKRIKKVAWTRIDHAFSMTTKTRSFKNALV